MKPGLFPDVFRVGALAHQETSSMGHLRRNRVDFRAQRMQSASGAGAMTGRGAREITDGRATPHQASADRRPDAMPGGRELWRRGV
jgi:hypothetical protein